jgi:hypothetical protein
MRSKRGWLLVVLGVSFYCCTGGVQLRRRPRLRRPRLSKPQFDRLLKVDSVEKILGALT